jgi:hypothetical protein
MGYYDGGSSGKNLSTLNNNRDNSIDKSSVNGTVNNNSVLLPELKSITP